MCWKSQRQLNAIPCSLPIHLSCPGLSPAIRSEADPCAHRKPGDTTRDLLLPGRPAALCSHHHGQTSTGRALAAAEAWRAAQGSQQVAAPEPALPRLPMLLLSLAAPGGWHFGAGQFSLPRQRGCSIRARGIERPFSSPGPGCAPQRRHFVLLPNTAITLEHVQVVFLWK